MALFWSWHHEFVGFLRKTFRLEISRIDSFCLYNKVSKYPFWPAFWDWLPWKSIVNQKFKRNLQIQSKKGQNENFYLISNSSHVKRRICRFLGVDVKRVHNEAFRDQKIKEKEGFIGRVTNCQKDKNHNGRSWNSYNRSQKSFSVLVTWLLACWLASPLESIVCIGLFERTKIPLSHSCQIGQWILISKFSDNSKAAKSSMFFKGDREEQFSMSMEIML